MVLRRKDAEIYTRFFLSCTKNILLKHYGKLKNKDTRYDVFVELLNEEISNRNKSVK